jgi:hypothetical protein
MKHKHESDKMARSCRDHSAMKFNATITSMSIRALCVGTEHGARAPAWILMQPKTIAADPPFDTFVHARSPSSTALRLNRVRLRSSLINRLQGIPYGSVQTEKTFATIRNILATGASDAAIEGCGQRRNGKRRGTS